MTPEMRKFIELLESQLGYREKAGAYTKFGAWYGRNVEFDADYSSAPWCDMLLAWAANKLGYEEWMGEFAWTVAHAKWFKKQGAWGTKPEPGAFVFFDWGGSNSISRIDHVGVVTKVSGGRIHTIEGNIDGGVAKRKVRDTSKVVGYGYPWKIKERLDAKAAAEEAAALESKAGLGTIQDGTGLAVLVPHVDLGEQPKVPPTTREKSKSRQKKAETPAKPKKPSTTKQAKPAPQAETAPSPATSTAPKPGKHAKPATADTSAVTTGPLPVITDASAASPAATVDPPALLTSALVAALAALAVAKAKTLRLRPATATAAGAHRRRSRKQTRPLQQPMELDVPRQLRQPMEPEAPRPLVDGVEPVAALKSLRALFPYEPIVIPEATSEFDAFSRPPRRPAEPEQPIKLVWDDDGRTRRLITDTGPIEIPREPGLYELPNPYSPFHLLGGGSGPFPIREEPLQPADAGRHDRAHSRAEGRADLRGRLEQFTPDDRFAADMPLRGRRHRRPADALRHEPFAPDAPLRGRRHRSANPYEATAHAPAHHGSHAPAHHGSYAPAHHSTSGHGTFRQTLTLPEPALTGTSATTGPRDPRADSRGRRGPRRGRHRA